MSRIIFRNVVRCHAQESSAEKSFQLNKYLGRSSSGPVWHLEAATSPRYILFVPEAMSSKAAIKAGGVTRVPMPQPNGLPVSVKCSKCGKWRRFFSLNNGPAAVRNESHMWTCEMSPDPERKTCQVEEEVAVGIQIPEDPNGPRGGGGWGPAACIGVELGGFIYV
eukprot:1343707-Amorphochlora_amoeboformis.AAC.1